MALDFTKPFETETPAQSFDPSSAQNEPVKDEYTAGGSCVKWLVFLIILAAIGFSVWYFWLKDREEEAPADRQASQQENQQEETVVEEDGLVGFEGGEVTHPSGAKVIIPEGALTDKVKIEILKARDGRVTDLYHLKPDGLQFKKPIQVIIPYKEENLTDAETPYDIALYTGDNEDALTAKEKTSVLLADKKVSTEIIKF